MNLLYQGEISVSRDGDGERLVVREERWTQRCRLDPTPFLSVTSMYVIDMSFASVT